MYSVTYAPPPEWRSGLFDCRRDSHTCCVGYCFPCILYAVNGQKVRGLNNRTYWTDFFVYYFIYCFTGCRFLLGVQRRTELRRKYNLPEKPCSDCCIHFWCHPCALCQEGREMDERLIEAIRCQISMQNVSQNVGGQATSEAVFATRPPQKPTGPSKPWNVSPAK